MIAMGLCAAIAPLGCSRQPYESKYPETASADRCSMGSPVWHCSHDVPRTVAVETDQGAVGAVRGTSEVEGKMSDEQKADMRQVERETLAYPSPYGAPTQ
jgi:hypothetical protein